MPNQYDSWNGAGPIIDTKIFDEGTKVELDLNDPTYLKIKEYLPPRPGSTTAQYLVARAPAESMKTSQPMDVLKIFVNKAWNNDFIDQIDDMEFTETANDPNVLESDVNIILDAGDWLADCKVTVYWDLAGIGKPMAKIIFENGLLGDNEVGKTISAFWCW